MFAALIAVVIPWSWVSTQLPPSHRYMALPLLVSNHMSPTSPASIPVGGSSWKNDWVLPSAVAWASAASAIAALAEEFAVLALACAAAAFALAWSAAILAAFAWSVDWATAWSWIGTQWFPGYVEL